MSASNTGGRRRGLLRLILPVAALVIVGAVFILASRGGVESTGDILLDGAALQSGLIVTNPRFIGEAGDGQPFSVSANRAEPDGIDPSEIRLDAVRGRISLPDGRELNATAVEGFFFPKKDMLQLSGGVSAETNDGYSLTVDALDFDLKAQAGESVTPVRIAGPLGELTADRMKAAYDGDLIARFEGDVRVVIRKLVEQKPR